VRRVKKPPEKMSGRQLFLTRIKIEGRYHAYEVALGEIRMEEEIKLAASGKQRAGPGEPLTAYDRVRVHDQAFKRVAKAMGYMGKKHELSLVAHNVKTTAENHQIIKRRMEIEEMAQEQEELDWELAFKALPLRETMETLVDDFLWVMNHPAMLRAQKANEISRPTIEDMLNAPSRAAVQLLSQGMNARTKFMDTMHKLFAKHGGKEWHGDEDETEGGSDEGLGALESFYKSME
jgi:hypothetical protein